MQQNDELHKLYEQMLKQRENRKGDFSESITPSCLEFCPELEKVERHLRKDISLFEKEVMIKKYQRSAAGKEKPFPEDIRPFPILKDCMNYLYSLILLNNDFYELYKFIENRSRAVRLDMAFQSLNSKESIYELEKIARFHILSNKLIVDTRYEVHLNMEQLKKIIISLLDIYSSFGQSNEEFVSYFVLTNLSDKNIPNLITNFTPKVLTALKIYEYFNQNNFYSFFRLFASLDFLSKLILLQSKYSIWNKSLNSLKHSLNEQIPFEKIRKMFFCENEELIFYFLKNQLPIENNLIDFKEKKDFIKNNEVFYKENKFNKRENFVKFIFYGDLDYKIRIYIINEFIKERMTNANKPIKKIKKVKKIENNYKIKEITKIIIIKYKIAELIQKIKNDLLNYDTKLIIIHDTEIQNILYAKNLIKNTFPEIKPYLVKLEAVTVDLLVQFNLSLFLLSEKNVKMANERYFMVRKLVNTSSYFKKHLNKKMVYDLINEPKIKKEKLFLLLDGKEKNECSDVIVGLIENGLNSEVLNEILEELHKENEFEDVDVYFYENQFI